MPLTATQRQFLIDQLQIQPRKRAAPDRKSKEEHVDESLTESLNEYLRREAEVLSLLNQIQSLPGTMVLAKPLETDLAEVQRAVGAVKRTSGPKSLDRSYSGLEDLKTRLKTALKTAQDNQAYFVKLDKLEKDHAALEKHKQKAHVSGELGTATTELTATREAEKRGDFVAAGVAVVKAQTACDQGKDFADKYAAYVPFKMDAARIVAGMKSVYANASYWEGFNTRMTTAAGTAEPPTRNYPGAKIELQRVVADLKADVERFYVTGANVEIAKLKTMATELEKSPNVKPGASAVQPILDEVELAQKQVVADIAASKWGQALMGARSTVAGKVAVGLKIGKRRQDYDTDRVATMGKIDALKNHKSLLGQMFSLKKLVERADGLASAESLRMEDGRAELKQIDATCAQLGAVAGDAGKYLEERVEADKEAIALMMLPGIGKLQNQLDSIDALLAQAKQTTGIVDAKTAIVAGPNMEDHQAFQQDWASALKQVVQARALIKTLREMAASLGDTAKALDAAGDAKDLEQVTKAAAELRKQAETAQNQPHADQAVSEFGRVLPALDKALQQAKDGPIEAATTSLKEAAELLLTARTVQAEYARTQAAQTPLAERARLLTISTEPAASSIKGKTDPLLALLQTATDARNARNWHAADQALTKAEAAAIEAELIARLRKEYNVRALDVEQQSHNLSNAQAKEIREVLDKARTLADAFNLDHANRLLDNAEARIAGTKVAQLAKTNPDDPELIKAIKKMLAAKGGEELQEQINAKPGERAIKSAPDGPKLLDDIVKGMSDQIPPKVIAMIAKERFGIDFYVSVLYQDGAGKVLEVVPDAPGAENFQEDSGFKRHTKRGLSGRHMYNMLAQVPEQAKDNPSMKRVERRDALKKGNDGTAQVSPTNGGFYQSQGDLVVMSGRPGDVHQQFGSKLKDGSGQDQLGVVEKGFEPADEKEIDYFDFAVVHEVGHAVDDRVGFMASREGQPAFGGWVSYGGNLAPIVKAVGKHSGYNSTPEQAEYINDVIVGASPTPPDAPDGEAVAWEEARAKVHAWYTIVTNEKLWWNQAQSAAVTIDGVVYQEAYKGTWVSYQLAARAKGITGYQFRAPGEWFAELYASYHMGKLKPGHPARAWLSSLSL